MVRIVLLAALLSLAACQTPRGGFCGVSEPIRLTDETIDAMTDAEVQRALEHNELGARLCGWRP